MDIRLELKEDIRNLTEKIHSVDNSLTEHKVHYALRANQIDKLCEQQEVTNSHLAEYNNQLTLHIAGVQELKSMNSNLVKYIHAIKDDIDKEFEIIEKRLEVTEAPIKWWQSTKTFVYITWSVLAALGATYAFYFQTWVTTPTPKKTPEPVPVTKVIE